MQVTYIGASCRTGVSQKSGNAYTIAELLYAVPDENAVKKDDNGALIWNYVGHGSKTRTLPIDPSKMSQFSGVKPFEEIVITLEPQPDNPTKNWVVGLD